MPPKPSRTYRSELRRRQAAATHSRILEAAAEVFAAEGFTGATIAQIAERAEVAVATVQKQGSKSALLRGAVELASFGVEGADDVFETDIGRAFLAIESADAVPAFAAEAFATINGPMAELWRALAMGASSDPELSAFHAEIVADIRRQDASVLGVLRDRGWLRSDVEPEDLLEAFCVITSIETYIRFVLSDRMPVTSYKRFVARLVRESILAT